METKHTPGPWRDAEEGVYCSAGPVVARVDGRGFEQYAPRNPQERDANARLIAAAPELLEVLKEVEEYRIGYAVNLPKWLLPKLSAAIAKAEGQ